MVDYELDDLKREFLDEARGKVDEMQAALTESAGSGRTVLERLAYLAHQLKGSGGSYGYSGISEDAAELEKAVEGLTRDDEAVDEVGERLLGYVQSLRSAIDLAASELTRG